jgi:hypothetical protein
MCVGKFMPYLFSKIWLGLSYGQKLKIEGCLKCQEKK